MCKMYNASDFAKAMNEINVFDDKYEAKESLRDNSIIEISGKTEYGIKIELSADIYLFDDGTAILKVYDKFHDYMKLIYASATYRLSDDFIVWVKNSIDDFVYQVKKANESLHE